MTDQVVPITGGTGWNVDTSELTVGSNTVERQRINIADPTAAAAIAAVTAKGTQAGYALGVQELHDTGRNITNYFTATLTAATASEALLSLTGYKGGAAVAATTTPAVVTTGKTYRCTSLTLSYMAESATAGYGRFTLRANTGGAVVVGSPAVANWFMGDLSLTIGVMQTVHIEFPEGMEFAAGTGIGISFIGYGSTGTATAALGYGFATLKGYEY